MSSKNEPAKASDKLPAKNPGGKGTRRRYPAINEESREILLQRISEGHTLKDAVEAAGISDRRRVLELRDSDAEFNALYEQAWSNGTDAMIEEARRRAVEGVDEAIVSAGKILGSQKVYSDKLLERLLAARHPAFRNQPQTTLTVNAGAEGVNVRAVQHGITTDDLLQMLQKVRESRALGEAPSDTGEVIAETDEPV